MARARADAGKEMNYQRLHWLEKFQIQVTALAALAIVYFGLWTAFQSWDPEGPITFVPTGDYGRAAAFGGMVWGLAAIVAALTVSARPEGALLAVLIGAAGASLQSPPLRTLLWTTSRDVRMTLLQFIVEVLLLAAVLVVAWLLIHLVRRLLFSMRPGWVWKNPLSNLTDAQRETIAKRLTRDGRRADRDRGLLGIPGFEGTRLAVAKGSAAERTLRTAACMLTACVVAVILTLLLLRSAQRGQILAALAVSFAGGTFAGHQFFPSRPRVPVWLAPLPVAVAFYALGAFSATQAGPGAWADVPLYARALPVDWLTAGAGGALLGTWLSARLHELRILEKLEEK